MSKGPCCISPSKPCCFKHNIPYPPAGGRWSIGFAYSFDFLAAFVCVPTVLKSYQSYSEIEYRVNFWIFY